MRRMLALSVLAATGLAASLAGWLREGDDGPKGRNWSPRLGESGELE